MRIVLAIFAKLIAAVLMPLGKPSADVAERAFEKAVEKFYER